jgi:hypothetical protein
MPTVASLRSAFKSISIVIYYNDHDPAHFHAIAGDDEAIIRIADLHVIRSTLSQAELNVAIRWGAEHQGPLALNWAKARSHLPLGRIA